MARTGKTAKRRSARSSRASALRPKLLKAKAMSSSVAGRKQPREIVDPRVQQQLKQYEEAVRYFQQQKYHKAKQTLEKVLGGPSKEFADRAQMHLRICEQRISRPPTPNPRTPERSEEHTSELQSQSNL